MGTCYADLAAMKLEAGFAAMSTDKQTSAVKPAVSATADGAVLAVTIVQEEYAIIQMSGLLAADTAASPTLFTSTLVRGFCKHTPPTGIVVKGNYQPAVASTATRSCGFLVYANEDATTGALTAADVTSWMSATTGKAGTLKVTYTVESSGSLLWLWIVLGLAVVGGGAYYYFMMM